MRKSLRFSSTAVALAAAVLVLYHPAANAAGHASLRALEDPREGEEDGAIDSTYYARDDDVADDHDGANNHGAAATDAGSPFLFSMWPPPPSTLARTSCFLQMDYCVAAAPQQLLEDDARVAIKIHCPDEIRDNRWFFTPSYILNRTDYLRVVVEHQRNMASDFCNMCRHQCMGQQQQQSGNNNYNQQNEYNNNNGHYQEYNGNNYNDNSNNHYQYNYSTNYDHNGNIQSNDNQQYNQNQDNGHQEYNGDNYNGNSNNQYYQYNNSTNYDHNGNIQSNGNQQYNQNQYNNNYNYNYNNNQNQNYYSNNYNHQGQFQSGNTYAWSAETYLFLPPFAEVVTSQNDHPFYYDCQACLDECHLRDTTSDDGWVETAVAFSTCGALLPTTGSNDTSIHDLLYAGPVCASQVIDPSDSPTMDWGVFEDAQCLLEAVEDPLNGGNEDQGVDLLLKYMTSDEHVISNAMWQSILTTPIPLACIETTSRSSTASNDPSFGWCQTLLDMGQSCGDVTTRQDHELCRYAASAPRASSANEWVDALKQLQQEQQTDLQLHIVWPQQVPLADDPELATYYDLTGGSLQFQKCHAPSSLTAGDANDDDVSYVTFQMCLGGHNIINNNNRNRQECTEEQDCQDYVVRLDRFLYHTTKHYVQNQLEACDICNTYCGMGVQVMGRDPLPYDMERISFPMVRQACDFCVAGPEEDEEWNSFCWTRTDNVGDWYASTSSLECLPCSNECQGIFHVLNQTEGYGNGTLFGECKLIYENDDDAFDLLFAAPVCTDDGRGVTVGVFYDEKCQRQDPSLELGSYVDVELAAQSIGLMNAVSHDLLHGKSLSCIVDTPTSTNDTPANYEVNDMCKALQAESFSCSDGTVASQNVVERAALERLGSLCPGSNEDSATTAVSSQGGGASLVGDIDYYDLTGSSVQYGQCHGPPTANQHISASTARSSAARPESISSAEELPAFAKRPYVSFQMCLGGQNEPAAAVNAAMCEAEQECQDYVVDLETYLRLTAQEYEARFHDACGACESQCHQSNIMAVDTTSSFIEKACDFCHLDSDNPCWSRDSMGDWYSSSSTADCDDCWNQCQFRENMKDNGLIDAMNFAECQMIYDPEDDQVASFFAGPVCRSDQNDVYMGVFADEDCAELVPSREVDEFILDGGGYRMKLSYDILEQITNRRKPLSCLMDTPLSPSSSMTNSTSNEVHDEINDMCSSLKREAFSCREGNFSQVLWEGHLGNDPVALDWLQSLCPKNPTTEVASDEGGSVAGTGESTLDEDATTGEAPKDSETAPSSARPRNAPLGIFGTFILFAAFTFSALPLYI